MLKQVILLSVFIFTVMLNAEQVIIFTKYDSAKLLVNNTLYPNTSFFNVDLSPGHHLIQVLSDDGILFTDTIYVQPNKTTFINADSTFGTINIENHAVKLAMSE